MDEHTKRNLDLHFEGVEMDYLCREVIHLLSDSMIWDGAHHKRWFLQEAIRLIRKSKVVNCEKGIAP